MTNNDFFSCNSAVIVSITYWTLTPLLSFVLLFEKSGVGLAITIHHKLFVGMLHFSALPMPLTQTYK